MREVLFRIWDKNISIGSDFNELEKPSGAHVDMDYALKSSYFVDAINGKYPIEQFTGKTGKNGVKIFEGDLIKEDHGHFTSISKVGFHNLKWVTYFKDRFDEWCLGEDLKRMGNYEVVGNIHEEEG